MATLEAERVALPESLFATRIKNLSEKYPHLASPLNNFRVFMEEKLPSTLEGGNGDVTDKAAAISLQRDDLEQEISGVNTAISSLKREIAEQEARIIGRKVAGRRVKPKTNSEILDRAQYVVSRRILSHIVPVVKTESGLIFSTLGKKHGLKRLSKSQQAMMDKMSAIQGDYEEVEWLQRSQTRFEEKSLGALEPEIVKDRETTFLYGLIFPNRIGRLAEAVQQRVREAPKPEEIATALDWLLEEADSKSQLEAAVVWLASTPYFNEESALSLAAAYESGDEGSGVYSELLINVAGYLARRERWDFKSKQADPFRRLVQRHVRADLADWWGEYGIQVNFGKRYLALPFAGVDGKEEIQMVSATTENVRSTKVIVELPGGKVLENPDFRAADLELSDKTTREHAESFARELRSVMYLLATNPFIANTLLLAEPIGWGDRIITHRLKPKPSIRIVANVRHDPDGTTRVVVLGGGPREGGKAYTDPRW
ncbi:hypothetical protein A2630_01640 [Candidatus Woesebacteria bacterium RIFCSPHIGHO2_01_FULL_44_10]|uniref:Uncharacterized protein n=1 Tax=Candidatus Woesebacteria bacterium RIFCSPLOWO2_01_FULL_44_14 TaxID=1802525 RepID=A0A1F8C1Y4_9BACT|nr:MAG: hypothetical protein A2630_01640 [Candidatus Woesebacteria bacterium RIFCSPHIGHO2_01_FULL_44_10]OGM54956.1 MAG: hypothetical protein A3F62_00940 [Candidatus Woesebacteria bacterium RIFCSPHIGHO2_12_FULL_44_11]OGM70343.1 MAG: hypothetical protein A2975_04725 [Candidatus Woesebacteria bacterium RIFCSPLOWO2_01_FULL_44_14]